MALRVLTERETLDRLLAGASIARFGDGELKVARGKACKTQTADRELAALFRSILSAGSGNCLVGIPRLDKLSPKYAYWNSFMAHYADLLKAPEYASAFITRADSAPWIDTEKYWADVLRLWEGRDVVIVRGGDKSLRADRLPGARSVREIMGPRQNAWSDAARLRAEIGRPDLLLLCLGSCATALAWEFAAQGVQSLDLGHIGMFMKRSECLPQ